MIQVKILFISFCITVALGITLMYLLKRRENEMMQSNNIMLDYLTSSKSVCAGGLIMMLTIIIVSVLGFINLFQEAGSIEKKEVITQIMPLMLAGLGYGLIGLVDDLKKSVNEQKTRRKIKLLGVAMISIYVVIYTLNYINLEMKTLIPFFKTYIQIPIWLYVPLAILILLAIIKLINLADKVNGLALIISIIIITCLTTIGIILNVKEIVILGSMVIGTCIGFLIFNLNPTKVMLGTAGSLLLGGIIGVFVIYLKVPFILPMIAIVPM